MTSTVPAIRGFHHVTFVVSDLNASLAWFARVLGATHIERLDHRDQTGERYACVMRFAGLDAAVQLKTATTSVPVPVGLDPITFGVGNASELEEWVSHLDASEVAHSGVLRRRTGSAVELATPDGVVLRFYTMPGRGGFDAVAFSEEGIEG
jgi:catechol 2,3-dioxygenase-like lactoylglutathione lyase family enzyme